MASLKNYREKTLPSASRNSANSARRDVVLVLHMQKVKNNLSWFSWQNKSDTQQHKIIPTSAAK